MERAQAFTDYLFTISATPYDARKLLDDCGPKYEFRFYILVG